jgi:hypothetical protein
LEVGSFPRLSAPNCPELNLDGLELGSMEELTDLQVVKQQEWEDELVLAPHEDALEFLEKVMRDPRQPMARRMRAAEKRADILYPKKAAIATMSMDENNFAVQLDRAIQRSGMMPFDRQIETAPAPAQPAPIPAHSPRQHQGLFERFRR